MEVNNGIDISKIHRYRRILAVQELYLEHKEEGITDQYIWKKYIYPTYFISISTFKKYMGINAKREINQIEQFINDQK